MAMRGSAAAMMIAMLAMLLVPCVLADPSPATGVTPGISSRRNLSMLNSTSAQAEAGNVTRLDINAITITTSWQGYYGNVTGNIVLADANNESLYEWGNATSITGEVYATRTTTVTWNTINCSNRRRNAYAMR